MRFSALVVQAVDYLKANILLQSWLLMGGYTVPAAIMAQGGGGEV